jgi:hypothetical protein
MKPLDSGTDLTIRRWLTLSLPFGGKAAAM